LESDGRLRYVKVFTSMAFIRSSDSIRINYVDIVEGTLCAEEPNPDLEAENSESGVNYDAEVELAVSRIHEQYPFPLRSLVEAKQKRWDPELIEYKRKLEMFRRTPTSSSLLSS